MANRDGAASALPWYRQAHKLITTIASTGAAVVSVLTFLYSFGVVGKSETRNAVGSIGVAWMGIRPAADTATSIGDTLHLAVTVTDRAGAVLVNARPEWSSDDPRVAIVRPDGSVVARGPGRTTITAAIGSFVARARVVVRQRVASVEIDADQGAGTLVLREGDRRRLLARAHDARGHRVEGSHATWRVADSTVIRVDSIGVASGEIAGQTSVVATVDGVEHEAPVRVVAAASRIAVVTGAGQHAAAGAALGQPVVVRVLSRGGLPVAGVAVRFAAGDGEGVPEPAAAMTDADGRARTAWTLGAVPGRQTLLALVEQVDSAAALVAEADPVPANTRVTALTEGSMGTVGTPLDAPAAIAVSDSTGRLLRDVPVTWVALDGTVEPLGDRTDSLGVARARWTLGTKARAQRLRVHVGTTRGAASLVPVTLTAVAMAGPPARVGAPTGTTSGDAVIVVTDAYQNLVPNADVVLSADAGVIEPARAVTDEQGRVRTTWSPAGRKAAARVTARVPGTDIRASWAVRQPPAPQQAGTPRPSTKARKRG